jgi:hypothetical protein
VTTLAPPITGGHQRPDGLWVFSRTEFGEFRFDYNPGEHVVFGGPSTRGKTRLSFNLLEHVATRDLPAMVAVSKPDDSESARQGARLGFRRVSEWPPTPKIGEMMNGKPNGYLVWPQMGNIETDIAVCAKVTNDLMTHTYAGGVKKRHAILVMDDTMVKAKVMRLDGQMVTILAMAGAMGIGLWIFVQKPTDSGRTTLWGYENATHLFLTKGGDARMLTRYMEIANAGEHGALLAKVIPTLEPYQFAYLHKYRGWLCIVDAG